MKKKVVIAFVGTLVIAAFVFNGMSFKPGSLHELKAKGECECRAAQVPYCYDPNGSFHPGYTLECN